ncbi:AlpA family phage regulatory protein [uncultured Aquabacterium sp.]|jgi:prophage regulatory protein|uniref:helix-turn-helix transcriptional regulator n=1 Tax=uncultured Aquabacterium sp. TaxID=158753 RepID=UPI00262B60A1|nr:AlpA family phage regulatory protein [uncultured Aquabacterium sp.]
MFICDQERAASYANYRILRKAGAVVCFEPMAVRGERITQRELAWTTISDGAPEAGGGGASAATGIEGGAPAGAGSDDDDDGGDADPEPARRRPHTNGTAPVSGETLLRLRGVQARVPLSKSAIYKLIAENRFPQPIRLSARCSLWRASEIDAFVSSLA